MTDTRSRQPQGIPVGGQFATEARMEPDMTSLVSSSLVRDETGYDKHAMSDEELYRVLVAEMRHADPEFEVLDDDLSLPLEDRALYPAFLQAREAQTRFIPLPMGGGVMEGGSTAGDYCVTTEWSDRRTYATGRTDMPYITVEQTFYAEAYVVTDDESRLLDYDEWRECEEARQRVENPELESLQAATDEEADAKLNEAEKLREETGFDNVRYGVVCREAFMGHADPNEPYEGSYDEQTEPEGAMWIDSHDEAEAAAEQAARSVAWGRDIFPENWK